MKKRDLFPMSEMDLKFSNIMAMSIPQLSEINCSYMIMANSHSILEVNFDLQKVTQVLIILDLMVFLKS